MKTKILVACLVIAGMFTACSDEKAAEKKQMDAVIAAHDSVMAKSEFVMKYKADLDTLYLKTTDSVKRKTIAGLRVQLSLGENAMETWMHKFNPDFTGKSHTEITKYLDAQQQQIHRIDSIINNAVSQSKKFVEAK